MIFPLVSPTKKDEKGKLKNKKRKKTLDGEGATQTDVAGGGADVDIEGTIHGGPGACCHIPDGNMIDVQVELGLLGGSRGDAQLLKSAQKLGGLASGFGEAKIELRNFSAPDAAGVLDATGDVEFIIDISLHLQVGIDEGGVGETVSEGPEGLDALGVVPLVSNQELLGVEHDTIDSGVFRGVSAEPVVLVDGERDGELGGGVEGSEQDVSEGVARLLSGEESKDDSLHLARPGHEDGTRAVEDHDGVGLNRSDGFDEVVLGVGEGQVSSVRTLAGVEAYANDGVIRGGSDHGGSGDGVGGGVGDLA